MGFLGDGRGLAGVLQHEIVLIVLISCDDSSVDPPAIPSYIEPMSQLDEELKSALAESEAHQADAADEQGAVVQDVVSAPAVSASGSSESPKRNLILLGSVLIAAAGILTLVFSSVDEAAIYSVTTDKLLAEKGKFADKNVRVEGDLVPGTLTRRESPCEYRFSIAKNGEQLAVRYPQCVVPDTFKDVPGMDVQVTAEGKLNAEGHFDATNIMAKCPSKYEMQQRAKKGEAAPHAALGAQ